MVNTCFPPGGPVVSITVINHRSYPQKNHGFLGSSKFSGILHVSGVHCWGIKHILYDSIKKGLLEACTWCPLASA